ncbi:MAG: hypothetical protein AAF810_05495 [Cyanobacteria bacterium P01_D01_bin.36]
MPFDPFRNIITLAGLQTLDTEATDDTVTDSAAPSTAQPALGGGTPPTADTADMVEPDPDYETGVGNLGLGEDLDMKVFAGALFNGAPSMHEPIQGFLGNCPLAAVLCAMTHVPAQRQRLRNDLFKEVALPVESNRQRKGYEYFSAKKPSPLPMASPSGPFKSNRLIAVRFQRSFPVQSLSTDSLEAGRLRKRLDASGAVPVTSVLFVNLRSSAIHYMRSSVGALWPSLIEKAYVVGRGQNTYQGLQATVGLAEAMRDMTGGAEEEHLVNGPEDTSPEINTKRLNTWLSQHKKRPIILGSPLNAPLVTGNHTFAVIGKTKTTVTVIDALKSTPAEREVVVPLAEIRDNFHEIVRGPG